MPDSISGPDPISAINSNPTIPLHHHVPRPADDANDTVTLSPTAQVSQLNAMGETPEIIAQSLGLPVATVNLDLGITVTPLPPPVVASVVATQLK